MLGWIRAHPVWSGIGLVVIVVVLWLLLSGDDAPQGATIGYAPQQQDPSVVAAGAQVQLAQYAYAAQQQQTQAAADAAANQNATNLQLATIAATNAAHQSELQAEIAAAKIASDTNIATLTTTMQAQVEQARITAGNQQAQLIASMQTNIAQMTAQIEQSRIQSDVQQAQINAQTQRENTAAMAAVQTQATAANAATTQALIQSNAAVAQAQIKASKKKICFITTAACEVLDKPDNCHELETLRRFRDDWLLAHENGEKLVEAYYACAPEVVASLAVRGDEKVIYAGLWARYIMPAVAAIDEGRNMVAFVLYVDMLKEVAKYEPRVVRYLVDCGLASGGVSAQAA